MPDYAVYDAIKRFFSQPEIEEVYQKAFTAYQERVTEVTITSTTMEGTSHSGQITGDPKELMEVCELILKELEAEAAGDPIDVVSGASHVDFSARYLEP